MRHRGPTEGRAVAGEGGVQYLRSGRQRFCLRNIDAAEGAMRAKGGNESEELRNRERAGDGGQGLDAE